MGVTYVEINAKTGEGVEQAIYTAAEKYERHFLAVGSANQSSDKPEEKPKKIEIGDEEIITTLEPQFQLVALYPDQTHNNCGIAFDPDKSTLRFFSLSSPPSYQPVTRQLEGLKSHSGKITAFGISQNENENVCFAFGTDSGKIYLYTMKSGESEEYIQMELVREIEVVRNPHNVPLHCNHVMVFTRLLVASFSDGTVRRWPIK